MSTEYTYNIGDEIKDTDDFGSVKIKNRFVSPTTMEVVYLVVDEAGAEYYCDARSFN